MNKVSRTRHVLTENPNDVSFAPNKRNQSLFRVSDLQFVVSLVQEMEPRRPHSKSDEEVVSQLFTDGVVKYCLPTLLVCVGGIFLMRRRVGSQRATRAEHVALSVLQYYGAAFFGLTAAMQYYRPTFEQKVLERIPNSNYAKVIRDRNAKN